MFENIFECFEYLFFKFEKTMKKSLFNKLINFYSIFKIKYRCRIKLFNIFCFLHKYIRDHI